MFLILTYFLVFSANIDIQIILKETPSIAAISNSLEN